VLLVEPEHLLHWQCYIAEFRSDYLIVFPSDRFANRRRHGRHLRMCAKAGFDNKRFQ